MDSYRLREIKFNGRDTMVVMQNENGPCPLLAIANVLLLRGVLVMPSNMFNISAERLMQVVAEYLLDNNKVEDNSPNAANLQKNLEDVLSVLPKLATGVDVNPSFDSMRGFEFTDEIAIFDLFGVGLVHGWLIDPQSEYQDLRAFTYNQLVGKLVDILGSETPVHLLTTHSSITSRQSSMKKETGRDFMADEPLIDLDSIDLESSSQILESRESKGNSGDPFVMSSSQDGPAVVKKTVEDMLARVESSFQAEETLPPSVSELCHKMPEHESTNAQERNNPQDLSGSTSESRQGPQDFSMRAQEWLQNTSSQLTSFGLQSLLDGVKHEQLVVFFRNNHFNTVYKKENNLYLLVTDQGYMSEPDVVWEKLDAVDGDTQLMTDTFAVYGRPEAVDTSNIDLDLQKALSASLANATIENGGSRQAAQGNLSTLPDDFLGSNIPHNRGPSTDADLALAMQLQEEEEREAAIHLSQQTREQELETASNTMRHAQDHATARGHPPRYSGPRSAEPKPFLQKVSETFKQLFGTKK